MGDSAEVKSILRDLIGDAESVPEQVLLKKIAVMLDKIDLEIAIACRDAWAHTRN